MKDPIQNVVEFILRNSSTLNINERIQLYKDTAAIIPAAAPRAEINRIIATLNAADAACREFSFIQHEDQI
jgi:hypothetical protein